jgi:hypothetical protein
MGIRHARAKGAILYDHAPLLAERSSNGRQVEETATAANGVNAPRRSRPQPNKAQLTSRIMNVRFWHKADTAEPSINVRSRKYSGHHSQSAVTSAFDPKRTLEWSILYRFPSCTSVRCRRPNRQLKAAGISIQLVGRNPSGCP